MPIPDWPRPFGVTSEEARSTPLSRFPWEPVKLRIRSLLLPFQTEPASLGFGLVETGGTEARSTPLSRFPPENTAPSCCRAVNSAMLPPVPTPENCPIMRGLSDMRGNTRRECFCLLLYLSDGSDQFPPNIQYFTGSTSDCQSFFRHLRRFFPINFVKVSRN